MSIKIKKIDISEIAVNAGKQTIPIKFQVASGSYKSYPCLTFH